MRDDSKAREESKPGDHMMNRSRYGKTSPTVVINRHWLTEKLSPDTKPRCRTER